MSHRYHPDPTRDPEFAFFYDDCEECEHQSRHLYTQDHYRWIGLWELMLSNEIPSSHEYGYRTPGATRPYRTQAEATACSELYRIYVLLERHTTIDPRRITFDYDRS